MNTENHYQETDLGNISLNPRGEYNPEESYEYLDLVVLEGGSYVCLAENGATITGISPESGKTTQYWQVITIPGSLTPEYIAMHDRVVNLSEQVEADAEEVRTAEQNVSGMELNVTQMQEQTRQSAEAAEQSKDSSAGYAASADSSRQAAEESEQNVNAQVSGFDNHVAEKTEEAENDIEAARIAANKAIIAQQEQSVNEVARAGIEAISTSQSAAQTATEKAQAADTSEKNAAASETAAKLSEANATKMAEQVAADKEQVANDRTAVENAKQEMTGSVAQIEQNAQGISELKSDISIIQDRQTPIDGIAFFNDLRIGGIIAENKELSYTSNSYGITLNENVVINVEDGCVFSLSDYSVYKYRYAYAYKNSQSWFMTSTPATNDLVINGTTGINKIIPMISKVDNSKITSDDLKNVHVTLYNPNNRMSEIDYVNKLESFYDTPKELKIIDSNSIISNISEESVIISDDVSLTINNSMGLFNKNIGGNGSITFEDWKSAETISNKVDVKKLDNYPYRSMHFPYDGTYANLEHKLPNFKGGTGYPFKEPIGAIYMDTDMNTSLSGLIRILEFKMFGWKNGVWYEISNNNISWCRRYNLPWSNEDSGVRQAYSSKYGNTNSVLINITADNPLDENHVIHFGCRSVYADEYDYYIVEYKAKANKNGFGAKVAIDTRNDTSGSPAQMMGSRVYALPKNEIVTVMAHTIPDSVFDYVIDGFDNYVPLKLNNVFCAHVAENCFIINMDLISNYVLKIEELQSGHVCIVSNDENGIAIVNENNIVNVNQASSRLEIVSNKDLYFNAFLSNINAILNYNADLF